MSGLKKKREEGMCWVMLPGKRIEWDLREDYGASTS